MASRLRSAVPALGLALLLFPGTILAQSLAPNGDAVPSGAPASSEDQDGQPSALVPDGRLPLEGTAWRLTGYRRGEMRTPRPQVAAWLSLRDGRVTGSGGCTLLRGRYARMGSAISIRLRPGAPAGCGGPTAVVQRTMRTALQRAASVEVTADAAGDQLVVRDAAGIEILRFEPDDVAALEAAEWRLSSYVKAGASIAADPDQVAVLAFRATERGAAERRSSGEAVGSSGCNGFLATYTRAGDVLRFGELESSDAPCIPALQAQEAAILAVLGSPETILDLPADRLILTEPESEDRLEYVTSTPLEGTTWRLERLAGSPGRLGVVTMRLSDGAVEGEGPCGSYHGTYDTDGSFITFRGVAAERSPERASTCPRADRERALLRALTDTVLVDRSGPGLRLLDVRGRVVARFSPAGAGP